MGVGFCKATMGDILLSKLSQLDARFTERLQCCSIEMMQHSGKYNFISTFFLLFYSTISTGFQTGTWNCANINISNYAIKPVNFGFKMTEKY